MLYAYLTETGLRPDVKTLLWVLFWLLVGYAGAVVLHELCVRALSKKPVKGLLRDVFTDPAVWLGGALTLLFGAGWCHPYELRGSSRPRRFFTALAAPAACFVAGVAVFVLLRLCVGAERMWLAYACKALFRSLVYTAFGSLVPLLPFSGGHIVLALLPERLHDAFEGGRDLALPVAAGLVVLLSLAGVLPQMSL